MISEAAEGEAQVPDRANAGYTSSAGVAHAASAPAATDLPPDDAPWVASWWDVSEAEYHASPLVSRGKLYTLMREGSDYYQAEYEHRRITTNVTASMRLGRLVHCAVLEPERWERGFCLPPPADLAEPEPPKPVPAEGTSPNTKEHRENLKRWRDEHARWSDRNARAVAEYLRGREIVRPDDHAHVLGMAAAVAAHPRASALLSGSHVVTERALRWVDADTGLGCRVKPDALDERSMVMSDLKSIGMCPRPENVGRVIASSWYHGQGAFYSDGYEALSGERPRAFVLVFVRSSPPYTCAVYSLLPRAVELGRREYRAALQELARRTASQQWTPEWSEDAWEIDLPGYVYQQSSAWMESING